MIYQNIILQNPSLNPKYCRYQKSEWVSKGKTITCYVGIVSMKKL